MMLSTAPNIRDFPKAKDRVVIALGYSEMLGGSLNPVLLQYLNRIGEYPRLNTRTNPGSKVLMVIPCGGATRLASAPELTEADVMASVLINYLKGTIPIHLERKSLTTSQNIRNARRIVVKMGILSEKCELVIFCKSKYSLKVDFLARRIFPEFTIHIETFDMGDDNPHRVLIGTAFDMWSESFPPLAWIERFLIRIKVRRS